MKKSLLFCILLTVCATTHIYAQKQSKADSLLKVLSSVSADTNKVNILNQLAIDMMGTDITKAKAYSLESQQLAQKIDFKKGEATSLQIAGSLAAKKGDFVAGIEYQYKSMEINEKIGSRKGVTVCLNNLGNYYYQQGNYTKSLENHFKALKERENMKDEKGILSSLNNLGLVYDKQKNPQKALEYYEKGLPLSRKLENKEAESSILSNIAAIYIDKKMHKDALDYNIKAAKLREEIKDFKIPISYRAIGEGYIHLKDYQKADEYFQKALTIATENEDLLNIAVTNSSLGDMYEEQKLHAKSIEFHLKGYEIAKEIGAKDVMVDALNDLKDNYAHSGDYAKAYKIGEEYLALKDSLFNEDKSKEIGKLEGGFELEKKLAEEKRLKDAKLTKEKKDKQRIINLQYSGIFLGLILAFIALIFTKRFNISPSMMEKITFFLFLIFFEFVLVFTEPILSDYTGGLPLLTLAANVVLALIFTPMHQYMEKKFKKAATTREKK